VFVQTRCEDSDPDSWRESKRLLEGKWLLEYTDWTW
jgi:hypothetical protein